MFVVHVVGTGTKYTRVSLESCTGTTATHLHFRLTEHPGIGYRYELNCRRVRRGDTRYVSIDNNISSRKSGSSTTTLLRKQQQQHPPSLHFLQVRPNPKNVVITVRRRHSSQCHGGVGASPKNGKW